MGGEGNDPFRRVQKGRFCTPPLPEGKGLFAWVKFQGGGCLTALRSRTVWRQVGVEFCFPTNSRQLQT